MKQLFKDEVRACGVELGLPDVHGVPPALPRPRPGGALPGGHHPGAAGGRAGVRRHPAGGVPESRPGQEGVAVLHRRAGLQVGGCAGQRPVLRVPGDHPRREHRGRHDRHGGAPGLDGAPDGHCPHPGGGPRREPCAATTCRPSPLPPSSGNKTRQNRGGLPAAGGLFASCKMGEGPARRYPWYQKSISSRAGGSKAAWIFSSSPSST